MRSMFYLALSAMATLANAASNPFNVPTEGYTFTAGSPTTLTWDANSNGTVSLRLQWGAVFTTSSGDSLAAGVANSGSFTWTPSASLVSRSDYAIEIINDQDTDDINYTPRFSIAGVTGTASTSTVKSTTSSSSSTSSSSEKTSSATATTLSTVTSTGAVSSTSPSSNSTAVTASKTSTASSSFESSSAASTTAASASSTFIPANAGVVNRASTGMLALIVAAIALV
ncbi:GPI anchored serine-threonine rich family protein [Aspergillus homomorphus CBS 101889]|uniref:Yeast cell wall synthesis Kre9/Knh1-like N-terminal domain-containing protein n=1 Tax=Aspergillus homomorphus (strain CBS 101889) TaxID=1450537 RepID=A0A395HHN3_ASPHC|nr:hypothetical protein BO97DRAFT_400068 [Aspergillus homomorphus CBS 101889]RAL07432.1 hypothetical protein BO97DRAFT_400068 [Aspergillus homomorphus CBS 101889]